MLKMKNKLHKLHSYQKRKIECRKGFYLHLPQTYTNTLTFEGFSIEINPCGLFPCTLELLSVVKVYIPIAVKSLEKYAI